MSVMNGFKNDLTKKILGLNPHIVINSNGFGIDEDYINKIKKDFKISNISKTFTGEGIVMASENAKGVVIKGIETEDNKVSLNFLTKNLSSGNVENFKRNTVFIGAELSYNLNLKVGQQINLMSSAFISTPFGGMPKQETFIVSGIFNTGFYEFDQNFVFLNLPDVLSIFDKENKDQNLELYLNDAMSADLLKEKINKINQNYFVYSWTDVNKSFFNALKVERNVMFIILTLILIVSLLI